MGKGVSAAEKKERMLKMFQTAGTPFTKKEVDKAAPKEGIVMQAVEGVLKELVSDDLVREAKIGGTLFYWSFPGEAAAKKRAAVASAQAKAAALTEQVGARRGEVEAARKASGQSDADAVRIKDAEVGIASFKKREAEAAAEMERLKKAGANNMALRRKDLPMLRDAANRWTDNSFEVHKYLVEKCGMERKQADGWLHTENMDYVRARTRARSLARTRTRAAAAVHQAAMHRSSIHLCGSRARRSSEAASRRGGTGTAAARKRGRRGDRSSAVKRSVASAGASACVSAVPLLYRHTVSCSRSTHLRSWFVRLCMT